MNKGILLLFFMMFLTGCGDNNGDEIVNSETSLKMSNKEIINAQTFLKESKKKVFQFLKQMNPELHQAINKIAVEIARADKKIIQLHELNKMYPNQSDIIEKALVQWQGLRKNLSVTLPNIYEKVEAAYVAYKIDEIQGKQKFNVLSTQLLKDANAVLADAETTKSTLEEELLAE